MRLAYIVSRFPHVSETFILRELDALEARRGLSIELLSLFPPVDPTVHAAARRWIPRLLRPGPLDGLRDTGWWLARRPVRLLAVLATVVVGTAHSPAVLARSLATLPLACSHARTLRRLGIDHVHAGFAVYPALAAWLCARLAGVSYSFTAHAYDLFVDQSLLARKLRDAAFVVAISEYNRRFLATYGGDRQTPVHVVHCGIRPADYAFLPRSVPATGPVRALCVASLQEYKGHRVLFEALAEGGERLARLELDLVGGGPQRPELGHLAEEVGIAGRVRFHGSLPEDEVRALLERADLFVLPSVVAADGLMEGLPVALMEALACGLPVVSTRLSGIPELVRHEQTGLLAEPGDPASLARALERVLSARDPVAPAAGRALVEAEFDVDRTAGQLAALFETVSEPPA